MRREIGTVMLEAAMIFPALLLILLGGYEFVRGVQIVTELYDSARQATNYSFRDCTIPLYDRWEYTPEANRPAIQDEITACVRGLLQDLTAARDAGAGDLSGVESVVSVYRYEEGHTPEITLVSQQKTDSGIDSRIDVNFFHPVERPESYQMIKNQKVVVVGESRFQYSPILPSVAVLFHHQEGEFNAAVMY